ncbi:MAG TPA: TraB/GumN family protein [Vicinamibacterales bacterium]
MNILRTRRRLRRRASFAALIALLCGAGAQAQGRSFVWKVTAKQGGTVYLAGSVHLLSAKYYPLKPAFDTAFSRADLIVEEVDMADMLAPESQLQMLTRGMLPTNQSLDKVISPETYKATTRKVEALGLPMEPLKRFKPWMLALTLQGMEWQKAGFDADLGLDKHFYDMAKTAGKHVQGLETLQYQISRFDEMPMDQQDRLLAETLKELETTRQELTKLADAWQSGDAPQVEKLALEDLRSEPEMYKRLLVERNQQWLPKIEALFSRPSPAFVIVGAAHLIGPDGLLALLRSKGYTIEQQ